MPLSLFSSASNTPATRRPGTVQNQSAVDSRKVNIPAGTVPESHAVNRKLTDLGYRFDLPHARTLGSIVAYLQEPASALHPPGTNQKKNEALLTLNLRPVHKPK